MAALSVGARYHPGSAVFFGEVVQGPEGRNLHLEGKILGRVNRVIGVQYLGLFPRQDLDGGSAANLQDLAVGPQYGFCKGQNLRLCEQVLELPRVLRNTADAAGQVAVEVILDLRAQALVFGLQVGVESIDP